MSSKALREKAADQRLCDRHRHSSVFASSRSHFFSKRLLSVAGLWKHELCRQRYQIASVRTVTKTRAERGILIDLTIGLGIPLLQIPLQYIVQGHRYNIFEDIGCLGETYETPLPSPSSTSPHPHRRRLRRLLCIKTFYHYRSQFRLLVSASGHANLSLNRYIRLMALASTNLLLTSFFLYSNVAVTDAGIYWRANPYSAAGVKTLRWATEMCALLFFAYFGFADEAIKKYCGLSSPSPSVLDTACVWDRARGSVRLGASFFVLSPPFLLYRLSSHSASKYYLSSSHGSCGASATLPVFIRKDTTQKRDSFDSFSDMSASYGGISPLEYDAEKTRMLGAGEHDGGEKLTLGDVSGMLPDYKVSDYSSSASSLVSSASDTESVGGEQGEAEIEVSSLHRASVHIPTPPEPAHARRSSGPDVPMPVVDAADIV
ncbi:pheromone A receptor-domain-containing protein [Mycena leptocephala]|nr:pheromone A receptor-domain-containing protein [Mycena leptocephala]